MAIYIVRSTRNVNMPPHPTTQSRYSKTCVLRERFSVRRHKHAKAFFLQTYLFLLKAVRTASESTKKMRPKYGNIRPVWTRPNQKDFLNKNAPFFTSVRPSVKTASAAGTTRSGRVDVLKPPVYSA